MIAPADLAILATPAKSTIRNSGFDGVSIHKSRVFGFIAFSTALRSAMSTQSTCSPHFWKMS